MYKAIEAAAIEIAYDNGGIFNGMGITDSRGESDVLADLYEFLVNVDKPEKWLRDVDAWLGGLTPEYLQIVSSGEEDEQKELLSSAPEGLDDFLNEIFEHCA